MDLKDTAQIKCRNCADNARVDFDFSYAFQLIVDFGKGCVFSYEALVRGVSNEPAGEIYQKVNQDNLYRFDQSCRVKAIDDFGSGYAGLNLLAEYQPDFIKLDRKLVTDIHLSPPRQAIARAVIQVCRDLHIGLLAEGVEDITEVAWFAEHGVELFQGNYFAEPGFEILPDVPAERLNINQ